MRARAWTLALIAWFVTLGAGTFAAEHPLDADHAFEAYNPFAGDHYLGYCNMVLSEIDQLQLAAITDNYYFQLVLGNNQPPGPFLFVMPRKSPLKGKAFFVESLSAACRTLALHLRAEDGSKAFAVLTKPQEDMGGDAKPYVPQNAVIRFDGAHAPSGPQILAFDQTWRIRLYGTPASNPTYKPLKEKTSEFEAEVIAAAKAICKIENSTEKEADFVSCVAYTSGQDAVAYERKLSGVTP